MMEKITFDNNDDEKSQKPIYLDEKSNDDINSHGDNPNKDSHNFTGPTKENTGGKITEIKKRNSKKDFIISEKKEENETNKQNDNRDENNIEFMSNILTDNIKSSFNEEDEKEKEEENNNCNNNSLENNDFERVSSTQVKEKEKEKDDDYTILKNKAKEKRLKRLQKKRKRSIQKTPKKKNVGPIFKISKLIYKRENYIKKYKTHFLQFLLELGKDLIKKCGFNLKLHMPNKELYQGEAGERENKEFISKTYEEVFCDYGEEFIRLEKIDNKKLNSSLQQINATSVSEIKDTIKKIDESKRTEDQRDLLDLFASTMEILFDAYYESESFIKFKSCRENIFYDKHFYKERHRKISLLEKDGFVNYVNLPPFRKK